MERLLTAVCMSLYFIQELIEMDKSKDRICEVVMIDGWSGCYPPSAKSS